MVFPPVALWVTVGLAVCLLGLLIALAAVCRRKIKESCEEDRAGTCLSVCLNNCEKDQAGPLNSAVCLNSTALLSF